MDKSARREVEVAVRWWVNQLRQGGLPPWVDESFGNPHSRLLAFRKLNTAPPADEQLAAFAAALRRRLLRAARRWESPGEGGSQPAPALAPVLLQTDYVPTGLLQQIGERVGIAAQAFPWKIAMTVQPGRVELQPGPADFYPQSIVLYDEREDAAS